MNPGHPTLDASTLPLGYQGGGRNVIDNQQQPTIAVVHVLLIQTMSVYLNDLRIMHDGSPINTNLRKPPTKTSL